MSVYSKATQATAWYKSLADHTTSFVKNNPTITSNALLVGAGYLLGRNLLGGFKRTVKPVVDFCTTNKRALWWLLIVGAPVALLLRLAALFLGSAVVEPAALAAAAILIPVAAYVFFMDNRKVKVSTPSAPVVIEPGRFTRLA